MSDKKKYHPKIKKKSEISQQIVRRYKFVDLKFVGVFVKSLFWDIEGLTKTSLLKLLFIYLFGAKKADRYTDFMRKIAEIVENAC